MTLEAKQPPLTQTNRQAHRSAGCLLLALLIVISACSGPEQPLHRISGKIFGTTYHITVAEPNLAIDLAPAIEAELHAIDRSMSSWRDDSELSQFITQPVGTWVDISAPLHHVLTQAHYVYQHSNRAFDPSLGPLIRLWGFQGERIDTPPKPTEVAQTLTQIDFTALELRPNQARRTKPIEINLSAIAKGYAVDRVADLLHNKGLVNFLVEIGGEIIAFGQRYSKAWRIGIETPFIHSRDPHTMIHLQDKALATSGSYRNYFESGNKRYQHILDPSTGYPVDNGVVSVSVIAPNCTLADGFATAFMLLGEQALPIALEQQLEVLLLIEKDGKLQQIASDGFFP